MDDGKNREHNGKWYFRVGAESAYLHYSLRDRSLFITWGGSEDFGGDHLIFRRTEGGISRN